MPLVTVRELLDAGMHYGHHVSRWNPKMRKYIFGKRNSIHIINLRETMRGIITGCKFLVYMVASGKMVVFVGTKRQAKRTVREEAVRCGMPFVAERWLGGTLTNFRTIRSRLQRLEELEAIVEGPAIEEYSKKEASGMRRELSKIRRNLDGIRKMDQIPGVVAVVDPRRERIAIAEAQRLNIPTICLADTDCDPDMADMLIPGNDDAMRSVQVVLRHLADAVIAGKEKRRELARAEVAAAAEAANVKKAEAAAKKAVPAKKAAAAKKHAAAKDKPAAEKSGKSEPEAAKPEAAESKAEKKPVARSSK